MGEYSYKKGRFPIGAWLSPPPKVKGYKKSFAKKRYFKLAKEAGLNAMYAMYENIGDHEAEVIEILKICDELDLSYLLNDNSFRNDKFDYGNFLKNYLKYKDYKSFAGLHVKDEPGVLFYENLKEKKGIFEKHLPDKVFYVNLLPIYATPYHLLNGMWTAEDPSAEMDYETYIDKFIEVVEPEFLSYDFYPCVGEFPRLEKDYFYQLELISKKAAAADLPFWVFIQVCSFNKDVRIPEKSEIFWQVNTALAYGAKGIQYFTFMTPPDNELECFSGSMLDIDGNKNASYEHVKEMNKQLATVGSILLGAKHKGVICAGTSPLAVSDTAKTPEKLTVAGDSIICGLFENESGGEFLYAVNNSITSSSDLKIMIKNGKVGEIIKDAKTIRVDKSVFEATLLPGEGVYIEIKEGV